jgi:hypothetical protein
MVEEYNNPSIYQNAPHQSKVIFLGGLIFKLHKDLEQLYRFSKFEHDKYLALLDTLIVVQEVSSENGVSLFEGFVNDETYGVVQAYLRNDITVLEFITQILSVVEDHLLTTKAMVGDDIFNLLNVVRYETVLPQMVYVTLNTICPQNHPLWLRVIQFFCDSLF